MVAIAKAYGQIRRGSGPWRTPFIVPLALLLEPPAPVSIDTGGTVADLTVGFVPISIDQPNTTVIQLIMKPLAGRTVNNIEVRVVLLKTGGALSAVDGGPLEPGDSDYVILTYRCPTGQNMPPEVRIELASAPDHIASATNPSTLVDLVRIDASTPGSGAPVTLKGGMVSGPMVTLTGVRTSVNIITGGDYAESAQAIRGIDLGRLADVPVPGATSPHKATYFDITATNLGPPPTKLAVELRTPSIGNKPDTAPTVAPLDGGMLRPGTYTYKVVFVHKNKNESAPSPASAPITVLATGPRAVRVTGLPLPPAAPNPDDFEVVVLRKRVYRTEPSATGLSGDDVFVAEVGPNDPSVDDLGPTNPAAAPLVRPDLMVIGYRSPAHLHLEGAVQLLDATTTTHYRGAIRNAPLTAKVTYQPGATPRLQWEADAPTDRLDVGLPELTTPFGNGVAASVTEVPAKFGLHWTILGEEYLEIGANADGDTILGQVGARLGEPVVPATWPLHEAHVAADLTDPVPGPGGTPGTPGQGLIALTAVRSGRLVRGAAAWAERDAADGRMVIDATFSDRTNPAAVFPAPDRTLRIRRRSPITEALHQLDLSAHALAKVVHAELSTPKNGPVHLTTDNRLRWVRALAVISPTGSTAPITVRGWLDDTTNHLDVAINGSTIKVETAWPVRLGATVRMAKLLADGPTTIRADAVITTPATIDTTAQSASLPAPGASGRVAISADPDRPLSASATPQARVLVHGSSEPTTGLRAITARVVGVRSGSYTSAITGLRTDHHPIAVLDTGRPNRSLRAEMYERERRIVPLPAAGTVAPLRSALVARTSNIADRIDALVGFVQPPDGSGRLVGAKVASSTRWGEGRVWYEPSYPRTANTGELGADGGIGNITAGFDGVPTNVEFWNLAERAVITSAEVAAAKFLPSVGPVGTDWRPGGAFVKVDGSIRLDHIRVATFASDQRACRNDDGNDHAVRYSKWSEVLAPFVELKASGGTGELLIWSAEQPNPTPTTSGAEPDPCNPPPAGPELGSAIGWGIGPNLTLSMAMRQYRLATRSGQQSGANRVRWHTMQTGQEEWGGEEIDCGEWELEVDLQMKDYANTVALYPLEKTSNPFGSWKNGPGSWRLRQRGSLKVPLFLFFGPDISSGDVYMGNAPGGTGPLLPGGIFNYIPPLFAWSYP